MTSGSFASIPISSVWVDRATRQRRVLSGIPELADSIRRLGLIHPIIVTRELELKAGERRFEACKSIGWTNIPVQWLDELDPTQLLLLELEENIKRESITWQEQCDALAKYHSLRSSSDETWNVSRTAEALGMSPANLHEKLQVHREMQGNKFIKEAPKFSTAKNMAVRMVERRQEAALQTIAPTKRTIPLVHADFLTYAFDHEFNFIHCDFPYGINFQDHDRQDSVKFSEAYDDSPENYKLLVEQLTCIPTTQSCHLFFWFSMDHYCWTVDALTRQGWRVNKFPLIWSKGNAGILPDPQRGPRRVYETALIGSKGDRKIVQATNNHFSHWNPERIHASEKPRPVLEYFFRMFVDEYTVMLDPTCGSGNACRVAEKLGAKSVLGIEKVKETYDEAEKNYGKD